MISPGDCLISKEPRDANRTFRVLAVYPAEQYGLRKTTVVCSSKGKITHFGLDRMSDVSRFEKWNP